MVRLWGKTFNYLEVQPGDELPVLIKWVTTMNSTTIKEFYETCDIKAYVHEAIIKTIPIENSSDNLDWVTLKLSQQIPIETNLSLTGIVKSKDSSSRKELTLTLLIESDDGCVKEQAEAVILVADL